MKDSLGQVVIIVHHIWLILAVGFGTVVLYNSKTLSASHHVLKINVMIVAFTATLGKWPILAVLYTDHQRGTLNGMFSCGNGKQIMGSQPSEHGLPLSGVALILGIELTKIYRGMRCCGSKALSPRSLFYPFGSLLR